MSHEEIYVLLRNIMHCGQTTIHIASVI